jgi:RNA polymerase-binding transcription factor DksA
MAMLVEARRRALTSLRQIQLDVDVIAATRDDVQRDDAPGELNDRETEVALRDELVDRIAAVDAAIDRIAVGQYGICLVCGDRIGDERLGAVPWTTTCLQHAA